MIYINLISYNLRFVSTYSYSSSEFGRDSRYKPNFSSEVLSTNCHPFEMYCAFTTEFSTSLTVIYRMGYNNQHVIHSATPIWIIPLRGTMNLISQQIASCSYPFKNAIICSVRSFNAHLPKDMKPFTASWEHHLRKDGDRPEWNQNYFNICTYWISYCVTIPEGMTADSMKQALQGYSVRVHICTELADGIPILTTCSHAHTLVYTVFR